jgi:hypothetical protein
MPGNESLDSGNKATISEAANTIAEPKPPKIDEKV